MVRKIVVLLFCFFVLIISSSCSNVRISKSPQENFVSLIDVLSSEDFYVNEEKQNIAKKYLSALQLCDMGDNKLDSNNSLIDKELIESYIANYSTINFVDALHGINSFLKYSKLYSNRVIDIFELFLDVERDDLMRLNECQQGSKGYYTENPDAEPIQHKRTESGNFSSEDDYSNIYSESRTSWFLVDYYGDFAILNSDVYDYNEGEYEWVNGTFFDVPPSWTHNTDYQLYYKGCELGFINSNNLPDAYYIFDEQQETVYVLYIDFNEETERNELITFYGNYGLSQERLSETRNRRLNEINAVIAKVTTDKEVDEAIEEIKSIPINDEIKKHIYDNAVNCFNQMPYLSYELLEIISDYNGAPQTQSNLIAKYPILKIATAEEGSIVTFGKFEQDNNKSNGSEPLKWYVCSKQSYNGRKLCYLLSLNVIHWMKFSEYDSGWSRSLVREWLNNTFYNNAFNSYEKSFINEQEVPGLLIYGLKGDPIYDKVTLLKSGGILSGSKLYGSILSCEPTEVARIESGKQGSLSYWLMDKYSRDSSYIYTIVPFGNNYLEAHDEYYFSEHGVRPLIELDLSPWMTETE